MAVHQILIVVAVVLFAVAALVPWGASWPKISVGWAGLAFFAAAFLF